MTDKRIRLGLPKGSLQEATFQLFRKAGFHLAVASRSYYVNCDDPDLDIMLIRAQEMSRYVEQNHLDAGLTGFDWIQENDSDVVEVCELIYSKVSKRPTRWVLCVPEASDIRSVRDLEGKTIATEVVHITRTFLSEHGVQANVEFSWGATEIKAGQFCDAIVEITETGNSLRANKLRIIDTLMESTTRLIVNREAWKTHAIREKLENISMLLQAAIDAEGKVGLKMNVPKNSLDEILTTLPALTSPTVSTLGDKTWVAVEIICAEYEVKQLLPKLKRCGACGIIEYPLNKVID
jgi:ATP phosphoribosyltransferase